VTIFPLTAIVGQEALVEALLINAVAPDVGGVLVRGERGTAKSTAVRALAPLLPPVAAADGQPFAFAPGERAPDGPVPLATAVVDRPAPLVERSTSAARSPVSGRSSPACWRAPTAGFSTWTRSTCCPTTSSTRCSTRRRPAWHASSATPCRSSTTPASCSSGR
jgi:hypothetical protein